MAKHASSSALASRRDLEQLVTLFKVLSDKTRLNVLTILAQGERNVTSLCEEFGLSQPTVSGHLAVLRRANVVGHRRNGKEVIYSLGGRVTTGKGCILELGLERLAVRVLPKHIVAKQASSPALGSKQDIDQLVSLLTMLADMARLGILMLLAQGERSVNSLCEELKLPQPMVSFHLGRLRMNNMVGYRQNGHQRMYSLSGRGTFGKDCILELPVHNLIVTILRKAKGYRDFDFIRGNHAHRS